MCRVGWDISWNRLNPSHFRRFAMVNPYSDRLRETRRLWSMPIKTQCDDLLRWKCRWGRGQQHRLMLGDVFSATTLENHHRKFSLWILGCVFLGTEPEFCRYGVDSRIRLKPLWLCWYGSDLGFSIDFLFQANFVADLEKEMEFDLQERDWWRWYQTWIFCWKEMYWIWFMSK